MAKLIEENTKTNTKTTPATAWINVSAVKKDGTKIQLGGIPVQEDNKKLINLTEIMSQKEITLSYDINFMDEVKVELSSDDF